MLFLVVALDYQRLEHYLSYNHHPDSSILSEISRAFPQLSPFMEFIRQRDFGPYDVERAQRYRMPRGLLRIVLAEQLKDLYDKGNYRDVLSIFEKFRSIADSRSKYYYILAKKKIGKIYLDDVVRFIRENYRSEYAYRLYRQLRPKLDPDILIKLLYFNKRYGELVRRFKPDRDKAFYIMSAYFKLRKRDRAYEICDSFTGSSRWVYYLRCAISSESAGDTALALYYIKKLHRYKPDKSSRLISWFALQDSAYMREFFSLPDTHDEVFFLKAMLSLKYRDTSMAGVYLRAILNRTTSRFEKSRAYFWLWKIGFVEYGDSVSGVHPFGYYAMRMGAYPEIGSATCIDSSDMERAVPSLILEAFGLRKYALKLLPREAYLESAFLLNRFGFYPLSIYLSSLNLNNPACLEQVRLSFPTPYRDYFLEASDSSGLPVSLLFAIAREESRFDSSAISVAGARGIIQMMPFQFRRQIRRLGLPDRPFHIRTNLMAGAHHFSEELEQLGGDYELTICAYNAGKEPVRKWIDVIGLEDRDFFFEMIPYRETRNYFRRVYRSWKIYEWMMDSSIADSYR